MPTMNNEALNTEEQNMQDTSFFTELAAVISGAKQSANQEFGRFWEKFVSTKDGKSSNRLSPYDLSDMKARKNIQGRIIPDNKYNFENNRKRPFTDYTTTTKTKISKLDLVSPFSSSSPPVTSRTPSESSTTKTGLLPPQRQVVQLTQDLPLPQEPTQLISSPIRNSVAQPSPIAEQRESSPVNKSPVNRSPLGSRPIRSPSIRRSIVSSTPNLRGSPDRPDIVTGSSKSVKRLTHELEEALSPRFPPPSPLRKETTPIRRKETTPIRRKETTPISNKIVNEDPFDSKPLTGLGKTVQRWTTEEEEERIRQLKTRIHSIQSQMKDEIALPSLTNITRESMSPQPQRFRVPVPPPLPPVNQIHTSTISPRVSLRPSNTSISSDEKPSPTEKHKLKMRELIQAIPFYQLRKADKIIGADGIERPNPFWNEIYGKRSR